MNQIIDPSQTNLTDPILMPVNPTINLLNTGNIPQVIPHPQNFPMNSNLQMNMPPQLQNNHQNEDTSKLKFLI
jgi:hypothetical protein